MSFLDDITLFDTSASSSQEDTLEQAVALGINLFYKHIQDARNAWLEFVSVAREQPEANVISKTPTGSLKALAPTKAISDSNQAVATKTSATAVAVDPSLKIKTLVPSIIKLYGASKVSRVNRSFRLQLFKYNIETTVSVIRKLQIGLLDVEIPDVEWLWSWIVENTTSTTVLKSYRTVQDLPMPIFDKLMMVLLPIRDGESSEEWSRLNLTHPIVGLIDGIPSTYWRAYSHSAWFDDQERLQLYPELYHHCKTSEAYAELLAKIIVKKHLVKISANNSKRFGILIPAPNRKWYTVVDMLDTGKAKLVYRLQPAAAVNDDDDSSMPEILLYRSSATTPYSMDSFTSFLSDLNPLNPPGYYARKAEAPRELDWLSGRSFSHRPLLMIGHSLGGSGIQLALVNYILQHQNLPNRNITVHIFDSPAIRKKDAKIFSSCVLSSNEKKAMSLNYHFSKDDIVPFAGERHLGYDLTALNNFKVSATMLSMVKTCHDAKIRGRAAHTRFYYRGRLDVDYNQQRLNSVADVISGSNKWKRHLVENSRVVGGLVLFPVVWTVGYSTRFVLGRRGKQSGAEAVKRKASSFKERTTASFSEKVGLELKAEQKNAVVVLRRIDSIKKTAAGAPTT